MRWTASDHLLRGTFCPPTALGPALEDLRVESGAAMALMLVAGPRGLLRSLCVSTSEDDRGDALTELLRRDSALKTRRLLRPASRTGEDAFPGTAPTLLTRLRRAIEDLGGDGDALVGAPGEWAAVRVPSELRGSRLGVAILLRDHPGDGASFPEYDRHVLDLAVMANATAEASVHHDVIVMNRVDEQLDARVVVDHQIDLGLAAARLVELALEITSSDFAAYYAIDFVTRTLYLRAQFPSDRSCFAPPEAMSLDENRLTAVSAARGRPVLLDREHSPTVRKSFDDVDFVDEMATPVPGPLPSGPITGVITVARGDQDHRPRNPYGAYDHALVRNVALRLALLRATADLETASEMFTRLTGRSTSGSGHVEASPTAPDVPPVPIPDDILLALPDIQAGLERIRGLTGSHSATFRAALPNRGATAPHGLALHRLAADPPDRLNERSRVQHTHRPSVNSDAALMGAARNVPFVAREQAYDRARDGSQSEISVPVLVEGMVVGVINLESPTEQNYDPRVSTAIAFAGHVGLVIANARLRLSRQLETYAMQIITRGHDLSWECRKIETATRDASPEIRGLVAQQLATIETRVRGLRTFARVPESHEEVAHPTMPQLVQAAITSADLVLVQLRIEDADWRRYDARSTRHVRECLRHVFANVQAHTPIEADEVEVEITETPWGGLPYTVVQVTNQTAYATDPRRAQNLYRVPVTSSSARPGDAHDGTSDVPRFGAYLAGSHARALGGDVHYRTLDDDHARVIVMVPSPFSTDRSER